MNYDETIDYLFNAAPLFQNVGGTAYKEGLTNIHKLDEHFHHPHTRYKTIHIAGTNGKGSCAHTLAAMLQHAGLRVGLYTSPHLVDFRERIRINGEMISKEYVVNFVEKERAFFEPLSPSFFEITTALAFKYFADAKVDIAVIEVGLGGRLDCTNIITPLLSIITNISFDHTQFLGNTLSQIAQEKAGIIKPHVPCVIGETTKETKEVFRKKAETVEAPIYFAEEEPEVISSQVNERGLRHYSTRHWGNFDGELTGEYQEKNTNTLLCAVKILTPLFKLTKNDVLHAFRNVCSMTHLRGRWQLLQHAPTVICDAGHNLGGWNYLGHQLSEAAKQYEHLHIVFGMANDKDVESVLTLLPTQATFYWTKASVRRAMNEKKLEELALKHHLKGRAFSNVASAYEATIQEATPNDLVYVGGSCFVVADLLKHLQQQEKSF